jgi:hypothetical protein
MTAPEAAIDSTSEDDDASANEAIWQRITAPHAATKAPETPPPSANNVHTNTIEQALQRLSDAARRIASIEQSSRRIPRASRLSPLRDISAEIQRHSTPLSRTSTPGSFERDNDLSERMPDLWPWLADADVDENENDGWANHTDPLQSRHVPGSLEAARIEEEYMRRATVASITTNPSLPAKSLKTASPRMRAAFVALAIMAALALILDSALVFATFLHPRSQAPIVNGPPTLFLSAPVANYGQQIVVHIRNFSSSGRVYLTRDIGQAVQTDVGSLLISVGHDGSADVKMYIDNNWNPGFHTIEAEDTTTRYTANATLQISAGPTRPSHLIVSNSELDLGVAIQGANTIQSLTLSNAGSAAISWSASSDQPWLLITPGQGIFSSTQTIAVAGQRANLKPGDYSGQITFSSNVGTPQVVRVSMTVNPLPPNAGAVLAITPAVLSFAALDGGGDPNSQSVMVTNPGSAPLYWSLTNNGPSLTPGQNPPTASPAPNANWLTADQTAGTVTPGTTSSIHISVHSQNLLPGPYIDTLVFSASDGHTALNSPQNVTISLNIQRRCGFTLNTGNMTFTAVSGQNNPSNQALSLNGTASCSDTINWQATSSASWLLITPASGQLKGTTNSVTTVGVNANNLKPGTYSANISVVTAQMTQSVTVQLTVQGPAPATAPIIGAAPLNLNFSASPGQSNPPGQAVTITNTGGSPLLWRTSINLQASSWLGASPTGGTIPPGQTAQLTVNVSASNLTPGNYTGQVVLSGTDTNNTTASGSPQTITVNFVVLAPCTLPQPTSSSLSFTAVQGGSNPNAQSVNITASGNCSWPLNWRANVLGSASWLHLSPTTGSLASSGQSNTLSVAPDITNLAPGSYSAQISVTAANSFTMLAQANAQLLTVSLTILQPCALQISSSNLSFSVAQGQTSSAQNLSVSESSNCSRPVSWSVSSNASWLVLATSSGTDNGSVAVSVNASSVNPGTYHSSVVVSASGSGNTAVQGSPQTVPVTLTVTSTGFTISGVVNACSDTACSSSNALPGATVNLLNGGNQVATVTADTSGNFSFQNIPTGSYTISVSGTDSNNIHYTGSKSIKVSGNHNNISVNAVPGP